MAFNSFVQGTIGFRGGMSTRGVLNMPKTRVSWSVVSFSALLAALTRVCPAAVCVVAVGHRGSGAVPDHYQCVLPWVRRHYHGVRRDEQGREPSNVFLCVRFLSARLRESLKWISLMVMA